MSNNKRDPMPIVQVPVGELLGAELEARSWSQADFAAVLDRPTQFVSEIITGKKEITRESAAQIGAALDQTAEYWLNLQDQYLLAQQAKDTVTQGKLEEVRRRSLLNQKAPIQLLQKRKILRSTNLDDLEAEVMDLFELKSLQEEPAFAAAARRGNHGEEISVIQRTWVACVRKEARRMPPVVSYSAQALRKLASNLSHELRAPEDFANLPERFAEVGVRLVYVEMLPGGKIDGCAMFVDDYPVIGISGRGRRLDKVLFTLLHEAAHILLEHVDASHIIAEELDGWDDHELSHEMDANREAAGWVFPDGFPKVPARINGPWVNQTAEKLGVARIVIIGHLQHRRRLDWRSILAKNAPNVNDVLDAWA